MIFREATLADIPAMSAIRLAVKENRLSNPGRITYDDYKIFLSEKGKGWVCEEDGAIAGFAIIDTVGGNVWALFVDPKHERKGIGRRLHDMMLKWYFAQGKDNVWLSTDGGTRAEAFYRKAGWSHTGYDNNGELVFEMVANAWQGY
jgi:GNAT superfamily N-acetyltransferase